MTNQDTFHLLIQTNSPGELSCWVFPFIQVFKKKCPQSQVHLFLTPCQYATGQEIIEAQNNILIDKVYSPKETIKHIFSLPFLKKIYTKGAVLCLGGDPIYTKLLGLKYRLPIYLYTEHSGYKPFFFKKVFYKQTDGDLMYERIAQYQFDKKKVLTEYQLQDKKYCLFLCGSRKQHFEKLLPFICDVVDKIKYKKPDFKAILQISPFISENDWEILKSRLDLSNFSVLRGNSLDLMSLSKLIVTLPSSANAEAMYLNKPMLVLLPLNHPELIILDGITGLIGNLPLLGKLLKKLIIFILKQKKRLYSIPNRLAGKEIVPEIVDKIEVDDIANRIIDLFYNENELTKISQNLEKLPKSPEIAQKISNTLVHSA
ncbi:hypothetical protein ACFL2K_01930 [Candidatus Margulisiibacteriota bacterium]